MSTRRLFGLVPSFKPVGGVIKVLDYLLHGKGGGWDPVLVCPEAPRADLSLFSIPHFEGLPDRMTITGPGSIRADPSDVILVSLPTDLRMVRALAGPGFPSHRIVHLMQNVRLANPAFLDGRSLRMLPYPFSRISVTPQVAEATAPYVLGDIHARTILLGHNCAYFAGTRPPARDGSRPLRVGYATWKSDIGDRVASLAADLAGKARTEKRLADKRAIFEFKAIREHCSWSVLRDLYHWCDVFLGAPHREEGFYLPALEAMAAGCLVVVPDAGGNRAFCRFGENCVEVPYGDEAAILRTLEDLSSWPEEKVQAMRTAAFATVTQHDLSRESLEFRAMLALIDAGPSTAAIPVDSSDSDPGAGHLDEDDEGDLKPASPGVVKPALAIEDQIAQRILGARPRMMPTFLIPGVMRSGTTSLFAHITESDDVLPPLRKEIHWFSKLPNRSRDWYLAHFPEAGAAKGPAVTGEASASYLIYRQAPARAAAFSPGLRILVILREPIARAVSHFKFAVKKGRELLDFPAAVEREFTLLERCGGEVFLDAAPDPERHVRSYLARGLYHPQILNWLEHFPREQLLLLRTRDLEQDLAGTIRRARSFIGLDPDLEVKDLGVRNRINREIEIPEALLERMRDYFRASNAGMLRDFAVDLGDWS